MKKTVDKYPEKTAYRWFETDGRIESVTWKAFYAQVKQVAKSLNGQEGGDRSRVYN